MAREGLTPQDLDARLKFILGITLGSILFLTSVGILLTTIYMIGMLFHSKKQFFRMGIDSIIVLILYILSIIGLVYINN